MVDPLMMVGQDTGNALMSIWTSFVGSLPGFVAALLLLIVGGFIAMGIGQIIETILKRAKFDDWVQRHSLSSALFGSTLSSILAVFTKWYVFVLFLGAAADLIQLKILSQVLTSLVFYIPALIGAGLILVAGLLLGEWLRLSIVRQKTAHYPILGEIVKLVVIYFSIVIGLDTVGFDVQILNDIFRIAFSALAIAIAFGLGLAIALNYREDIDKAVKSFKSKAKK